jgi:hypothetical protein
VAKKRHKMKNRITPEVITTLQPNDIFVFGSNLAGIHGAGAAKQALQFGATFGKGIGLVGNTFAIPTKDIQLKSMLLEDIRIIINAFIFVAIDYPNLTFLVTKIGCGLAGYTPNDIAPLFKDAINVDNIHLPTEFWEVLNKENL